jgi:hypothetical protein
VKPDTKTDKKPAPKR